MTAFSHEVIKISLFIKLCCNILIKLHKVCINDDPGLTLTYFTERSNLVAYVFEWGKLLDKFEWENLAANDQIDSIFKVLKMKN